LKCAESVQGDIDHLSPRAGIIFYITDFAIGERGSDGNPAFVLLHEIFQAFCLQIDSCFHLDRNDVCAGLNDEIDFGQAICPIDKACVHEPEHGKFIILAARAFLDLPIDELFVFFGQLAGNAFPEPSRPRELVVGRVLRDVLVIGREKFTGRAAGATKGKEILAVFVGPRKRGIVREDERGDGKSNGDRWLYSKRFTRCICHTNIIFAKPQTLR
jgi:hypothetical protein